MSKGKCLAVIVMSAGTNWIGQQFDAETPGEMHGTPILHYLVDATKIMKKLSRSEGQELSALDSVGIQFFLLFDPTQNAIKKEVEEIQQQIKKWEQEKDGNFLAHILIRCQDGFYRSSVIAIGIFEQLKNEGEYDVFLCAINAGLNIDLKKNIFGLTYDRRMDTIKGIIVSSSGKNWVEPIYKGSTLGEMPGVVINNIPINAQEMMGDPAHKYPHKPGTEAEVIKLFEAEPEVQNWINQQKKILLKKIKYYLSSGDCYSEDKIILHIRFTCKNGFQRSPYAAEVIGKWIREELKLPVEIIHLTLTLTDALTDAVEEFLEANND